MITPISNSLNSLNIERIRAPRRINFKGAPDKEAVQQNQDTFEKQKFTTKENKA